MAGFHDVASLVTVVLQVDATGVIAIIVTLTVITTICVLVFLTFAPYVASEWVGAADHDRGPDDPAPMQGRENDGQANAATEDESRSSADATAQDELE